VSSTVAERRWRNRPLERERDRERLRWLWGVFVAIVLMALPAGAYLVYQNASLKLQYELSGLKQTYEQLQEQERQLKVERAKLESLARVEGWARRECGLVPPPGEAVFVLTRRAPEQAPSLLAQVPSRTD